MQANMARPPRRSYAKPWWQRPLTATEKKILLWAATLGTFAPFFDWRILPVVVAMLLIHEQGHIWAANRLRLRHSGCYAVPLVGAVVFIEEPVTLREEMQVALMGPVFGLVAATAGLAVGWAVQSAQLEAVAVLMGLFNLVQLLPLNCLDGGRVLRALAFSWHELVGIVWVLAWPAAAEIAWLQTGHWQLAVVLAVLMLDAAGALLRWQWPPRDMPANYRLMRRLDGWQLLAGLGAYLATAGGLVLVVGFGLTHPAVAETVTHVLHTPGL